MNLQETLRVNPRVLLRGLVLVLSLVAAGVLLRESGLTALLDEAWIDREVRGHGLAGELLFLAVATAAVALGFPRLVIAFLAGYAFDVSLGSVLALAASVGGCVIMFSYARLLGRDMVARRYPARIRKVDTFLKDNPLAMTMLVRLLPVGSNAVTNLAAGVSSVPALAFFAGSAIGYVPQTVAFALAGSGIHLDPALRTALAAVLLLLSALIGVYLYRKMRRGKAFDDGVDRELGADGGEGSFGSAGANGATAKGAMVKGQGGVGESGCP